MILAYHIIFTAYGFWLPNDPRGSWSDFVRSWELLKHGHATKVNTSRSLARAPHDRRKRLEAKRSLKYKPVVYTGRQALSIARGFRKAVIDGQYIVHACAIMPDHVHLVVKRDTRTAENIAAHFKRASARRLREDGRHPFQNEPKKDGTSPSPWVRGRWKVFLNAREEIIDAVEYVAENPIRDGLKPQNWPFVTPYV